MKLKGEGAVLEVQGSSRQLPLKDQPIDVYELDMLWEQMEDYWRELGWLSIYSPGNERERELLSRLKEIKHRFFNQLVY